MKGPCNSTFLACVWGPGEGSKGQIQCINKFQLQCQFQRFSYHTMCVFSQIKDIKTYRTGFLFCRLCNVPGMRLEVLGGQNHGHVAYQIEGDDD